MPDSISALLVAALMTCRIFFATAATLEKSRLASRFSRAERSNWVVAALVVSVGLVDGLPLATGAWFLGVGTGVVVPRAAAEEPGAVAEVSGAVAGGWRRGTGGCHWASGLRVGDLAVRDSGVIRASLVVGWVRTATVRTGGRGVPLLPAGSRVVVPSAFNTLGGSLAALLGVPELLAAMALPYGGLLVWRLHGDP